MTPRLINDFVRIQVEEQLRNTEAHQRIRENPERRQEEQIRNTEARQRIRQNPERREEEQIRNTEAHRHIRLRNLEQRRGEQERDTMHR